MKQSKYNIGVETSKGIICYNTLSDSSIYLSKEKYANIFESSMIDDSLVNIDADKYKELIDNKFFVSDNIDEYNELCIEYESEVTKSKVYELTLLPSLDCNLRCWYCFEKHIHGSHMTSQGQDSIFNYVKDIFQSNSDIEHLNIELFGGEPLLYFQEELYPLLMRIKLYLESINKCFHVFFVTNGVCIKDKYIPMFKELNASFQISIDGYKEKHDRIKFDPKTRIGTYDHVISVIKKLTASIDNIYINLRINYDDETLLHMDEIIKDLIDVDRSKIGIHLERIWQTCSKSKFPNPILNNVINMFILNNFKVSYMNLHRRSYSCKSSKNRQAVISYDGTVYKCLGRDFSDNLAEGKLKGSGIIEWDQDKLSRRLSICTFNNDMCRNCKFLPQCWGPCSQKLLEDSNIERYCQLNLMELTLEQYIIYRFNNNYTREQIWHKKLNM